MYYIKTYRNVSGDFRCEEKGFHSLSDVTDWIFDQMTQNYSDPDAYCLPFKAIRKYDQMMKDKKNGEDTSFEEKSFPPRLEIQPNLRGRTFFIGMIYKENGDILFSDGTFTSGQKHWNEEIRRWMRRAYERQIHPVFPFAD